MSLFCYIGPWLIRFLLGACVFNFFYAVVYHSMCCRCFEKIGVQALLASIFGGLTACLSAFCFGDSAQAILAFAFCGVLLCTALIDIETLDTRSNTRYHSCVSGSIDRSLHRSCDYKSPSRCSHRKCSYAADSSFGFRRLRRW